MEIEKSARLLYLYQDFVKGVGVQKKLRLTASASMNAACSGILKTFDVFLPSRHRRERSSMTHGRRFTGLLNGTMRI